MSLDKNVDNKKEKRSSDLKKKLYAVLTYKKSTGEMCHEIFLNISWNYLETLCF